MAGTAKPKDYVYNQLHDYEVTIMTNLSPQDVDTRLTETREEFSAEHDRLWNSLDDERISRIAGDETNAQSLQQNVDALLSNESRLSTEVVQREEGDLRNIKSLTELAKALSDYRIKTDLELANEKIARDQLGIDLNHKIDMYTSTFDHKFYLVYQYIDDYKNNTDSKLDSFDERVKKYEDMLQDITTDSIQITMDNGEINMGAWTILSQARQWDLEILGKFKDYQTQTSKDIDDALKDIQDKLPVEKDIIDKALEALANSPIVKELDEKLNSSIEDIDGVQKQLLAETEQRRQDMINLANNTANTMKENQKELLDKLTAETKERVDAVQREAQIRQEQLVQESNERTAEIEEKLEGVWAGIDEETKERLEQIDKLNDGLTKEIQERTDGDTKNLQALENYKQSTDTALGNIQTSVDIAVSNSNVAIQKVDALDGRLTTIDQNANAALSNSATALDRANIAISESSVTAGKVAAVEADMVNVKNDVAVNAKGLTDITATVSDLDGEVKANTKAVTDVQAGLKTANDTITSQGQAINSLEVTTKQTKDELATVVSDVSTVKADLKNAQEDVAANGQAIQDITIKVGQNTDGLTSLGQKVTTIENSVADLDKTKADASYVETIDNKVTDLGGVVTSNTNDIVTIKNNVNTIQGDLAGKASTEYVDSVNNQTQINKDAIKAQQDKLVSLDASINQATNAILINGGSDLTNDLTRAYNTPGKLGKISNPAASNTNYIVIGDSSGADNLWIHSSRFLVFDPKRMYRLRVRFSVYETKAGTTTFYFGLAAKTADKTIYVNSDGVPTDGPASSFYMIYALQPPVGQWVEREFYISGRSLTGVAAGNGTLESPSQLMNNAAHIAPLFIEEGATTTVLLDYMSLEIADDIKLVNGQAKVIESLTTQVNQNKDGISTLTNKTDILENSLNIVEGKVEAKAETSAVQIIDNRVTQTEQNISSNTNMINSINNNLNVLSKSSQNILIKSNKVKPYVEGWYPHAHYDLGEPWVIGEKYTLIYCAEHKRESRDQTTFLVPYAGGGMQDIASARFPINGDKQLIKATFVATELATAQSVHFYLINHASGVSDNTVATVYWAVLVRGEFGSATNWFPSAYDYMRDWTAQSDVNQTLSSEINLVDGRVTNVNNSVTTLAGRVGTVEGDLLKKADSSALVGLQTKQDVDNAIALSNTQLTASLYSGNTNLLQESSLTFTNTTKWAFNGGAVYLIQVDDYPNFPKPPNNRKQVWQVKGNGGAGRYQSVFNKLKVGDTVTASVWARGDSGGEEIMLMSEGVNTSVYGGPYIKITSAWQRYSVKGTVARDDYINFTMYLSNRVSAEQIVYFSEVQLERGLIGSDWSESVEETQTRLDATAAAISETRTAVDRVDGRVASLSTDVTNLTGRVNTTEGNISGLFDATSALYGRVEAAENNITVSSQSINNVKATLDMNVLPSKRDTTKANQWLLTHVIPKDAGWASQGAGVKPDFSVLKTGIKNKRIYCADGNTMFSGSEYDNTVFYFRTIVQVNTDTSVNLGSFTGDDAHSIYVNGVLNFTKGYYGSTANLIISLKQGLNTVDVICYNGGGLAGFTSSVLLSSLVVSMYAPESVEEQAAATANAVSSLTATVSDLNGVVSSQASQVTALISMAESGYLNNKQVDIDLTDPRFDQNKWYPIGIGRLGLTRNNLRVWSILDNRSHPTWQWHPRGFTVDIKWEVSGAEWGSVSVNRLVHAFVWQWTDLPPCIRLEQLGASSREVIWLRGGGKYYASIPRNASIWLPNSDDNQVDPSDGSVFTPLLYTAQYLPKDITNKIDTNTTTLQVTNQTVDGIKAISTVSVDNNGFISGYGLISQLVNGVVQSAFGVNADYFYVGTSTSNRKKPFMVLTSPQTIDGTTYPAGTWIDVAMIANATIGTAHIADASITNAKIANLDAGKITTGYLDAARLKAGSISADKMTIGLTDNLWPNRYFDPNGPLLVNSRVKMIANVTEIGGYGMQIYGRDHVAYSLKMPVRPGDQIVIEYTAALGGGPNRPLGVGLWVYDDWGQTGTTPWQYGPAEQLYEVQYGWYRYRRTFTVANNGSGRLAKSGALYFLIEQGDNEADPTYWNIGDVTVRRRSGGELIVDGSITAAQLNVNELSAISGNLGTMITYADPSKPTGARTIISGDKIEVYDDNNVMRVRIGRW